MSEKPAGVLPNIVVSIAKIDAPNVAPSLPANLFMIKKQGIVESAININGKINEEDINESFPKIEDIL